MPPTLNFFSIIGAFVCPSVPNSLEVLSSVFLPVGDHYIREQILELTFEILTGLKTPQSVIPYSTYEQ